MNTVNLFKGLSIFYLDEEKDEFEKITNLIKNNGFLFKSMDGVVNDQVLSISEFHEFMLKQITEFLNDKTALSMFDSNDFYVTIYIFYLIFKHEITGNTIFVVPDYLSIEYVQFLASIRYYNFDANLVYGLLLANDNSIYDEIFEKIKNEHRTDIYEYCLKYISSYFIGYDKSIADNMEIIINNLISDNINYTNSKDFLVKHSSELKPLSEEEFEILFKKYMSYINAPNEWLEYYYDLKRKKLISFEYSADVEDGMCYLDKNDNVWKIKIISDGSIKGFVTFVHEFVHYITEIKTKNDIDFFIQEFPSIYFERITADFLIENGYSKEILKDVMHFRNFGNLLNLISILPLITDVLKYKKLGFFSIEDKINSYSMLIESINEMKMKSDVNMSGISDYYKNIEESGPEIAAYEALDIYIEEFVKYGIGILDGFKYLISAMLASNILEDYDRKSVNEKMMYVMSDFSQFSLESIIKLFNINLHNKKISDDKSKKQNMFIKI